jgi:putative PIN family toxin of toxin-antitoxin system
MRITADTNMLVSATFWYGASEKIISKAEAKEIQRILSDEIVKEYKEVLDYEEIRDKKLVMRRAIEKIISISTIIDPKIKLDVIKHDPDDNTILECAVAGNADYIITNKARKPAIKCC